MIEAILLIQKFQDNLIVQTNQLIKQLMELHCRNIPIDQVNDVHTEHCCVIHGCKYQDCYCTVATKQKVQSYLCESCQYDQ